MIPPIITKRTNKKRTKTFTDYRKAIEYVAKKNTEGYKVELCGGHCNFRSSKQQKQKCVAYIIGDRQKKSVTQRFSPIRKLGDPMLTNTEVLNRFIKDGIKPLRTKEYIIKLAIGMMKAEGIEDFPVKIMRMPSDDGYTDMCVRTEDTYAVKRFLWLFSREVLIRQKPKELRIHPVFQYSYSKVLKEGIQHEINHIQEYYKRNRRNGNDGNAENG